jgi:hypothetical protein
VFIVFLIGYTAGLLAVLRFCKQAGVKTGAAAGGVAILANVAGLALGAATRAWLAPAVAILAAIAASKAFTAADDGPRDDELERWCNQAGQSLVAVATAEAMMLLVGGVVWALN